MIETRIALPREAFTSAERELVAFGALRAHVFRYPSGIEAVRLANARGAVVVLPFFGQMVWRAGFDGVDLTMHSMFPTPRASADIAGTYGCFAFHSGLLANGVPGAGDSHPVHGEFPTLALDEAALEAGEGETGPYLRLVSAVDHARGFGPHYRATPSVTLTADTRFEIAMAVENLSYRPMPLMYMCHVNFAFVPGGEIRQPLAFTPEKTAIRRAVPAHVTPTPAYLARIAALAADPAPMARLDHPDDYDPEQVFYLRGLATGADGLTQLMLRRPEGDGFAIAYRPEIFPKTVRWILANPDQSVAAFALPATCEPEGFTAEREKGNLRFLAPGARAAFSVRVGYVDQREAAALAEAIAALGT
jgi:hypothetical protein